MPATFTEIAKEAKVSLSLVSRFFNEDPTLRIRDDKRDAILRVTERLGGVRRRSAMATAVGNIVWLVPRTFSPTYIHENITSIPVTSAFEAALKENNFRLSMTLFDPDRRLEAYEEMIASPDYCRGLVVGGNDVDERLSDLLRRRRFPHVCWHYRAESYGINTVSAHAMGGLRQAVSHLTSLGHRRIGYLGPRNLFRYPLFLAALTEAGLTFDEACNCMMSWPSHVGGNWQSPVWTDLAREAFGQWLDRGPSATAMVCHNDMSALGAVSAMRERGLAPGRDVSILGYDNVEQRGSNPSAQPMLTSVDNPMDIIGRRCAEVLINQIRHKQSQIVHEHIPVKLIVRDTTGPSSAYDSALTSGSLSS